MAARIAKTDKTLSTLHTSMLMNLLLTIAVVILAATLVYTNFYEVHTYTTSGSGSGSGTGTASTNSTSTASANTLAGINQPFNSTELASINDEPLSYYELAGQRLLNGTLADEVITSNTPQYNALIINGKPSVIYVGAISCIFCGENRWAMALALGTFGNFSQLFYGYSSLGDGDVPTIYWAQNNVTTTEGVTYGNYYNSKYINFISSDYDSPIVQGFEVQPLSYFISKAPNSTYLTALTFMNNTGKFQGTPFTFWGTSLVAGADAIVFGNSTPSSTTLPLAQMTHAQVLSQFRNFNDQFAWGEYAAADIYIAQVCPTINSTAPVCSLPAIKAIESEIGS